MVYIPIQKSRLSTYVMTGGSERTVGGEPSAPCEGYLHDPRKFGLSVHDAFVHPKGAFVKFCNWKTSIDSWNFLTIDCIWFYVLVECRLSKIKMFAFKKKQRCR
jgi:hypothetical protein